MRVFRLVVLQFGTLCASNTAHRNQIIQSFKLKKTNPFLSLCYNEMSYSEEINCNHRIMGHQVSRASRTQKWWELGRARWLSVSCVVVAPASPAQLVRSSRQLISFLTPLHVVCRDTNKTQQQTSLPRFHEVRWPHNYRAHLCQLMSTRFIILITIALVQLLICQSQWITRC